MKNLFLVCIFPIISFHISRSNHFITGNITYSLRKIILTVGDISYYVKPYSVRTGYVHGDRVIARITKRWEGGRMSEVEIISLVSRSRKPLLARVISKKWKYYFTVIPDQWNLEIPSLSLQWMNDMNCIFTIQFISDEQVKIISKFGSEDDIDIEERLILWLSWARTKFSEWVIRESEEIKKIASETSGGISEFLNKRTDFRDWYTLTIDWPDAKDIDDALYSPRKMEIISLQFILLMLLNMCEKIVYSIKNPSYELQVYIHRETLSQCFQKFFQMISVVSIHERWNSRSLAWWR